MSCPYIAGEIGVFSMLIMKLISFSLNLFLKSGANFRSPPWGSHAIRRRRFGARNKTGFKVEQNKNKGVQDPNPNRYKND